MKRIIIPLLLTAALATGCGYGNPAEAAPQEHPLVATETPRAAIVSPASDTGPQMEFAERGPNVTASWPEEVENTEQEIETAIAEPKIEFVIQSTEVPATTEMPVTAAQESSDQEMAEAITYTVASVVEETPADIPSETVHAKTGYIEPEPEIVVEPELTPAAPTADLDAVMAAANAYAACTYGCTIDTSLGFTNSDYRYPAYTSADADQAIVEAKARDMVDFTFEQLMGNRYTVEDIISAAIPCNVYAFRDGDGITIYCFYYGG